MLRERKRILCLVLSCLLLLTGCGESAEPQEPELMIPVESQQERKKAVITDICSVSMLDSEVTAVTYSAGFKRSGYIKSVNVRIGDQVEQGDLLAVLDSADEAEAIAQQEKRIADYQRSADNTVKELNAQIELKRIEIDLSVGLERELKQLELEELQTTLTYNTTLFEQELIAMKEELAKLQKAAVDYELYAPESGTVASIGNLVSGSRISAGQDQFVIVDMSQPCLVTTRITEEELSGYDRITAQIGATVYELEQFPYSEVEKNSYVYSGRVLPVRFTFGDAQMENMVGEYCAILLYRNVKEQVLAIPSNALLSGDNGEYVYVNHDGEREYRRVTTGTTTSVYTEITDGLVEGEEVFLQQTALAVSGDYTISKAQYEDLKSTKQINGARLGYTDSVSLSYSSYGTVDEVFVSVGDWVEEGESLMTISIPQDRMTLLNAEIALKTAEADYRAEIARLQTAISEKQTQAETAASASQRGIAACEAEILEAELERYIMDNEEDLAAQREEYEQMASGIVTFTAPCSGYIETIAVRGNTSGFWTTIGSIISSDVPLLFVEDSAGSLKYNATVTVTPIQDKTTTYEGRVIYASNTVPSSLWRGTAIVQVEDLPVQANLEFTFTVEATLFELENVLTVNYAAIDTSNGYSALLLENGIISTQVVNFGKRISEKAWILYGLEEGQELVIR